MKALYKCSPFTIWVSERTPQEVWHHRGLGLGYLQDICMAAGWASPSTFIRFYNLEVLALLAKLLSV